MMMCVLRVFTPSSRPLNTRLLTQVPVVEPFLQVLHDVLPVWRKPHIVRVAMHLQVLDDLPTLGFRELRPDHSVLRRTAQLPWNVTTTKFVTGIGVSGYAGVEPETSLGERFRFQPQILRIEVARAHPEFLVARVGRAKQLVNRGD